MGAAADDLARDDDERSALRRIRDRKAAEKRDADERSEQGNASRAAFHRLKAVLSGEEAPTRESADEYRKRKGM
jgi:hypothetical protein